MSDAILPGATLGMLGSGQLGRMFAIAARRMGYRIHVLSPDQDSPTGQVADREYVAEYEDLEAVREFAQGVSVVSFEFENVPASTTETVGEIVPVRPGGHVLHVTQNRNREKTTLSEAGLPVTPFAPVRSEEELRVAVEALKTPGVLKTAGGGYDGKGQRIIQAASEALPMWEDLGRQEATYEAFIDFQGECSLVAARGVTGEFVAYPLFENEHANHILDVTLCPARVPQQVREDAEQIARAIFEILDVVGVLCVEYFWTQDDRLLINELAPRPHNSGHLTVDAHLTCQFEQQVRAVCGLPLGSVRQHRPSAMVNLLGDLWEGGEPDWKSVAAHSTTKLHLYGKHEARIGRKMGHLTALADDIESARSNALAARETLK
ncbi:MAG: 5-(carboxyamino)imidazole ribonucleotide synthase [Planctomycetaceae bacterium]|nr:5-(carboxyamino)imidazole ribonucleotide synthase [Planctomycetaceae bacterium]